MTSVKDSLPEHNAIVLVLLDSGYYAIAEYSKDYGFSADDSGYDFYCHDNSGLYVSLEGNVIAWSCLPE